MNERTNERMKDRSNERREGWRKFVIDHTTERILTRNSLDLGLNSEQKDNSL